MHREVPSASAASSSIAPPVVFDDDTRNGLLCGERGFGPEVGTSRVSRELPARAREAGMVTDIAPPARWPGINVRELWAYRELFFFLVWRDVKVRYAQTVLGVGWVIVQPVLTMLVFTVVFGKLAKVPSDGVPYPLFSLAALIPWNYFSNALAGASRSLTVNTNLITKVYFPRLVIPFASLLSGLVNFAVTLSILLLLMVLFGTVPSVSALLLVPAVLLVMMMAAAGVGCWLAALALQYRDVHGVAAFLVQAWMYASPVVYPLSLVPAEYRWLYLLNPMVGVIEGFRSVLLGATPLPWAALTASAVVSATLCVSGVVYFRRMEQSFADVA